MTASLSSFASLQSAQSANSPSTSVESTRLMFLNDRSSRPRHAPSRSLGFFSKDTFASLIRTHSGRHTPNTQREKLSTTTDRSIIGVLADYASNTSTMLTSRENDAILNPAPRKSENRLYNFFHTRSRSRSKSKNRRSQSAEPSPPAPTSSPAPPLPTSSHARHSSLDDYENRQPLTLNTNPSATARHGSSKPTTRSQSRPLSSTTTGTHSTITSLVTPTQTRMGRSKGIKYGGSGNGGSGVTGKGRTGVRPASTCSSVDLDLDTQPRTSTSAPSSPPRSHSPFNPPPMPPPPDPVSSSLPAATSKQPTSTRIRLHNLFGIPLINPRRSSFGSRSPPSSIPSSSASNLPRASPHPTSPQPLPSKYANMNSKSGISHRRATSPGPLTSDHRTKEKEKRRSATAPASWLTPRFFSGSGTTIDRDRDQDPGPGSPPPLPLTVLNADSTSTLQTSTTHTHASSHGGSGVMIDRGISSSIHAPRPQSRSDPIPPVPKIMHTPPTPQKGVDVSQRRRSVTSPSGNGTTHGRNRSLVVYGDEGLNALSEEMEREERLKVERAREESKRGRWSPRFFGGGDWSRDKGKEKERMVGVPIDGRSATMNGHGNGTGLARVGSRRSKHGNFDFEGSRPLSGGSSTTTGAGGNLGIRGGKITTITAPAMAKSRSRESRESRENAREGKLERTVSFSQGHTHAPKGSVTRQPSTASRMHRRGIPDAGGGSGPGTNHLGPSAYSSTANAKKPSTTVPAPPPIGLSSSWGRATTATTTTTSTTYGNGGSTSLNGKRRVVGLSHGSFPFEPAVPLSSSPPTSEFGVIRSGDSGYQESYQESAVSATANNNSASTGVDGRRGKGRSLDLNIGLAWAPTKVKQEAVMSSFLGMKREREEEWKKFESGVTEIFRNVLGEAGFATFKKYIRRFDAQTIPFDGPSGLITRVETLLNNAPAPGLDEHEKQELLDRFIRVVLQHA